MGAIACAKAMVDGAWLGKVAACRSRRFAGADGTVRVNWPCWRQAATGSGRAGADLRRIGKTELARAALWCCGACWEDGGAPPTGRGSV